MCGEDGTQREVYKLKEEHEERRVVEKHRQKKEERKVEKKYCIDH